MREPGKETILTASEQRRMQLERLRSRRTVSGTAESKTASTDGSLGRLITNFRQAPPRSKQERSKLKAAKTPPHGDMSPELALTPVLESVHNTSKLYPVKTQANTPALHHVSSQAAGSWHKDSNARVPFLAVPDFQVRQQSGSSAAHEDILAAWRRKHYQTRRPASQETQERHSGNPTQPTQSEGPVQATKQNQSSGLMYDITAPSANARRSPDQLQPASASATHRAVANQACKSHSPQRVALATVCSPEYVQRSSKSPDLHQPFQSVSRQASSSAVSQAVPASSALQADSSEPQDCCPAATVCSSAHGQQLSVSDTVPQPSLLPVSSQASSIFTDPSINLLPHAESQQGTTDYCYGGNSEHAGRQQVAKTSGQNDGAFAPDTQRLVLAVMHATCRAATRPDYLQAVQHNLKPASHAEQDRRPMQITDSRLVHGTPLFKALLADLQLAMAYRPPVHTGPLLCLGPTGGRQVTGLNACAQQDQQTAQVSSELTQAADTDLQHPCSFIDHLNSQQQTSRASVQTALAADSCPQLKPSCSSSAEAVPTSQLHADSIACTAQAASGRQSPHVPHTASDWAVRGVQLGAEASPILPGDAASHSTPTDTDVATRDSLPCETNSLLPEMSCANQQQADLGYPKAEARQVGFGHTAQGIQLGSRVPSCQDPDADSRLTATTTCAKRQHHAAHSQTEGEHNNTGASGAAFTAASPDNDTSSDVSAAFGLPAMTDRQAAAAPEPAAVVHQADSSLPIREGADGKMQQPGAQARQPQADAFLSSTDCSNAVLPEDAVGHTVKCAAFTPSVSDTCNNLQLSALPCQQHSKQATQVLSDGHASKPDSMARPAEEDGPATELACCSTSADKHSGASMSSSLASLFDDAVTSALFAERPCTPASCESPCVGTDDMRGSKQQSDDRAACSTAGTSTYSSPVASRSLSPQQLTTAVVHTGLQGFSSAADVQDSGHGLYEPQQAAANMLTCLDNSSGHDCDDHHLGCSNGSDDSTASQPRASIIGRDRYGSLGCDTIRGSDQPFRTESDTMHHAGNLQQAGVFAADPSATGSNSISSNSTSSSDHQHTNCIAFSSQLGPVVENQDNLLALTTECGVDEQISAAPEGICCRQNCEHSLIAAVTERNMAADPKCKAAVCTALPACKHTSPSRQSRFAAAQSVDPGSDEASASVPVLAPTDVQAAQPVQLTTPLPVSLSDVPEQATGQPALLEADEGSLHCTQTVNHVVSSVNGDPLPLCNKLCSDMKPPDAGLQTDLRVKARLQYVGQLIDVCNASASLKELLLSDAITFDYEADEGVQHLRASVLG